MSRHRIIALIVEQAAVRHTRSPACPPSSGSVAFPIAEAHRRDLARRAPAVPADEPERRRRGRRDGQDRRACSTSATRCCADASINVTAQISDGAPRLPVQAARSRPAVRRGTARAGGHRRRRRRGGRRRPARSGAHRAGVDQRRGRRRDDPGRVRGDARRRRRAARRHRRADVPERVRRRHRPDRTSPCPSWPCRWSTTGPGCTWCSATTRSWKSSSDFRWDYDAATRAGEGEDGGGLPGPGQGAAEAGGRRRRRAPGRRGRRHGQPSRDLVGVVGAAARAARRRRPALRPRPRPSPTPGGTTTRTCAAPCNGSRTRR